MRTTKITFSHKVLVLDILTSVTWHFTLWGWRHLDSLLSWLENIPKCAILHCQLRQSKVVLAVL